MSRRLDPYSVSPESMEELISFQEFLRLSDLERSLVEIVRARVSQLNGCVQGIARHMRLACDLGETHERLTSLVSWRTVPCYTAREKAALEWTEAVTLLPESQWLDGVFEQTREWFTETEIVKLTMIVAATNAWNRVERSFWRDPLSGSAELQWQALRRG